MLLVLNVVYYGKVAAQVAREIHRSRSWACQWLKRYDEQDIDGLKDIPKSGRRPELPVEIEYKIKTILKESNQGWTTKQIEQLIVQNTEVSYIIPITFTVLLKNGVLNRKCQEKYMLTQLQKKRKRLSKKDRTDTCGYTGQRERVYCSIDR
jgi:transposase